MKPAIFTIAAAMLISFSLTSAPVLAMGGGDTKTVDTSKQDFAAGKKAVYAAKYNKAIMLMTKVLKSDSKNANAYNYLGFSYRKKGNLKLAAASYKEALDINPNHKGALEYQGEMYLKLNNFSAANSNLAHLERLCSSGCKELTELKRAIADYAAMRPARGS